MVRIAKAVAAAATAVVLISSSPAWAGSPSVQAGYRAKHDAFRSVHASWIMPSVRCPAQPSSGYNGEAWFGVGMGPSYSSSEQVVTRAFCTGVVATYVAYFESGGVQAMGSAGGLPVNLHPGDKLSASVSYVGDFPFHAGPYTYRVGRYRFSINDQTQRKSFTVVDSSDCLRHRCDHSTAEVMAGIPSAGYSALADYGKVTFSGIAITDARRHHGSFAKNKHWKVTRLAEFDGSALAASSSSLTHRGTQFSDTWRAH